MIDTSGPADKQPEDDEPASFAAKVEEEAI